MKVKIAAGFYHKLGIQVAYIAKDKPKAARKFQKIILLKIKQLEKNPLINRPSIYFNDTNFRDLIVGSVTIVYHLDLSNNHILVFGFKNRQDQP